MNRMTSLLRTLFISMPLFAGAVLATGCVDAEPATTTGEEDLATQVGGDGDGDVDSEALKPSESDVGQPSDQPTHSLLVGCAATSKSWAQSQAAWNGNTGTAGSYICNGNLPVANHGDIVAATLTSTDRVGSAQYTCSNGTWLSRTGATCNGKVVSTTIASGISMTCSSADPVRGKWIGWYLADLKRCADTAGLDWWVNNYNNNADCLATDNYHGYGSKDACWRAQFRSAADANGNSYSEAQVTGHIAAESEAAFCNGMAYPWTSVTAFGTNCKSRP